MQISTRNHDYLIDTLELRHELHILNDSFTNPNILKVQTNQLSLICVQKNIQQKTLCTISGCEGLVVLLLFAFCGRYLQISSLDDNKSLPKNYYIIFYILSLAVSAFDLFLQARIPLIL